MFKKHINGIGLTYGLLVSLLISGCSHTTHIASSINSETPAVSMSTMTPLLACAANNIVTAYQQYGAFHPKTNPKGLKRMLVVIDKSEFSDGTVRKLAASDGPLADENQAQMKAILNRWLPYNIISIPSREVPILRRHGVKGSAISRLGTLPANDAKALREGYKVDTVVYFSGAFTKLDNDIPLLDDGIGKHLKVKGSLGLAASTGQAKRTAILGLSASVGHVDTNIALTSTLIEARIHRSSGEIKFSVVPGDVNFSMSKKLIISEGVQGTQQMLLEAAALWFIGQSYPEYANLGQCFNKKATHPMDVITHTDTWEKMKPEQRITWLQTALQQRGYLTPDRYQQGVLDQPTQQAMRRYAIKHKRYYVPYSEKSLAKLYQHLLRDKHSSQAR